MKNSAIWCSLSTKIWKIYALNSRIIPIGPSKGKCIHRKREYHEKNIQNDVISILSSRSSQTLNLHLALLLQVPHMNHNPLSACWVPYSILGFGDILVPGLLLSYCHAFDLAKETPFKLYWTIANICE